MKLEKKRILLFLIFILIFLTPLSILYSKSENTFLLTILMLTPMISSLLTRLSTKEGFRNLNIKPDFKKNWKLYIKAYFLPPFLMIIGATIFFLLFQNLFNPLQSKYAINLGVVSDSEYSLKLAVIIPIAILINPIAGLIQCFGEEFAWRGYLLTKLVYVFGERKGVLINGILWGLWHSPIILTGFNYGKENSVLGVFAMILFCIVIGNICSYLFLKSKSVIAPTIFHASLNAIDLYAPASLFMRVKPNLFIGPNPVGIIGGIGFIGYSIFLCFKYKNLNKMS
ncbi:CPBP family intramembrane glutamic endopeptidase [Anaerorhabdus furcosa]|uniref:CAAX protease self-immunity n=1 Tax=Anaerorhabdus furcosa TaxID=118967 RepID=A0A1T4LM77_9FIRM|nr:CPBP family intramembrane glutamic endopeptidase [Anaerorhabdus furcosa]SJZ55697.1 CAAX protease self-immunity [Anaerorhabdus furcosa]